MSGLMLVRKLRRPTILRYIVASTRADPMSFVMRRFSCMGVKDGSEGWIVHVAVHAKFLEELSGEFVLMDEICLYFW